MSRGCAPKRAPASLVDRAGRSRRRASSRSSSATLRARWTPRRPAGAGSRHAPAVKGPGGSTGQRRQANRLHPTHTPVPSATLSKKGERQQCTRRADSPWANQGPLRAPSPAGLRQMAAEAAAPPAQSARDAQLQAGGPGTGAARHTGSQEPIPEGKRSPMASPSRSTGPVRSGEPAPLGRHGQPAAPGLQHAFLLPAAGPPSAGPSGPAKPRLERSREPSRFGGGPGGGWGCAQIVWRPPSSRSRRFGLRHCQGPPAVVASAFTGHRRWGAGRQLWKARSSGRCIGGVVPGHCPWAAGLVAGPGVSTARGQLLRGSALAGRALLAWGKNLAAPAIWPMTWFDWPIPAFDRPRGKPPLRGEPSPGRP